VINSVGFLIFGYDKLLAKKNKRRISEFRLLLLAGIGGIFGAILGMYFFKHKTNKFSFLILFYTVVFIEMVVLYYILKFNPDISF
jgi:uncharacterized membrane protein YsdA (DUF1294 family)